MRQTREPAVTWDKGMFTELLKGQTREGMLRRIHAYQWILKDTNCATLYAATEVRWDVWLRRRRVEATEEPLLIRNSLARFGNIMVEAQLRAGFQVLDA